MRQFINVSWNNSSAVYDGSQQMAHFTKNGGANTKAYADPETVKKAKKVKAPDFRSSTERAEDRLDARRSQFEKAFEKGVIDFDRYNMLLTEWEVARSKLDKKMGLVEESTVTEPKASRPSIMPAIERAASSFASRHPFATLVTVIVLGSMVMNAIGFGA